MEKQPPQQQYPNSPQQPYPAQPVQQQPSQTPQKQQPATPVDGRIRPPPPPAADVRSASDEATHRRLLEHGWPTGLRNALVAALITTPVRYMICDDSGSMMVSDGHWVVAEGATSKMLGCSRWSELTETLRFHINTAHIACAPTEFRMLNGAAPVTIGSSAEGDVVSLPILSAILDGSPGGGTPLCRHVNEIAASIAAIAPQLRAASKKAALVIFTDGEASDGDLSEALKPLHNLPVWVVVRLCTDEDSVVKYWSDIDAKLELNMDVLDDPMGESVEIQRINYWLTYGTPLHRLREFGVTAKEFDMLDEAKLTSEQMRSYCAFLFGVRAQDLPHPDVDWNAFHAQISQLNDKEPLVWSSVTKAPAKWINMNHLTACYGPKAAKGKVGKDGKECVIA